MEPSNKKRRLAPKADKTAQEQIQPFMSEYSPVPVPNAAPPERNDFEAFARHLQDAAVLIYARANRSPYTSVSVLLLRWEDDPTVEEDLQQLQQVFAERYKFQTESWSIPSCPNPSVKLTMQMAQHIEHAKADHLLIVYYAGYGFVGPDHHLYWACNARDDSSRLKWEGVRCLLEDAQSDILLLLDTCAVADAPAAGNHGVKQAIAAYSWEHAARQPSSRSFTSNLVESLKKLGTGRAFSTQRLHEEIISLNHNAFLQENGTSNGSSKATAAHERLPICFTWTPGTLQSIILSPLDPDRPALPQLSPPLIADETISSEEYYDQHHTIPPAPSIIFDEPRALVCTTFLGEPSQDMASFKSWLSETPIAARKISVEGMFNGPPTVLLISMPIAIWNVVAADRTSLFLGYINSHNMTYEYLQLLGLGSPLKKSATTKELEDGKILLEARQAASTPVMNRHEPVRQDSYRQESLPVDGLGTDPLLMTTPIQSAAVMYPDPGPSSISGGHHDHVEDSVEMHEAAEQLKALSHVRHDRLNPNGRNASNVPSESSPGRGSHREGSVSSQEPAHSGDEQPPYDFTAMRIKPRKPPQRQKQDTRCSLCSHAPFKDLSSLKKHIAAAHTRPFPCAFSFAGCTSTFGSKNEWKRHIASQHLCLTFYRCSSCPSSSVEGKGNEFNRKDLFTQHLRRMHAPFQIKKAIAKGDSKLQIEWEAHVKSMQQDCLVRRREPPQRSACPKADCANIFEGAGSWDDWTEHVGRHMEKGEAGQLGVDKLLARWALDENIIEKRSDGSYRLLGSERDGINGGQYSDSAQKSMEEMTEADSLMMLEQ